MVPTMSAVYTSVSLIKICKILIYHSLTPFYHPNNVIFSWFLGKALPGLLCNVSLKKKNLIPTDQDVHMITSLESYPKNVRHPVSMYGNAVHRLCRWHKVWLICNTFQCTHLWCDTCVNWHKTTPFTTYEFTHVPSDIIHTCTKWHMSKVIPR